MEGRKRWMGVRRKDMQEGNWRGRKGENGWRGKREGEMEGDD